MKTIFLIIVVALLISPSPALQSAPGIGKYDDTHFGWVYSGIWLEFDHPAPYNGTIHYTATPGNSASFEFDGRQFILTYSGYINRGGADIFVDGIKITALNEYAPDFAWQSTYISPVFSFGIHTLMIRYVGGGVYIDVDAIEIVNTNEIIPTQYQGQLHLFALMGQSNMIGLNSPPENQPTSPTIFNFGNDYRWHIGVEPVDNNNGQVDTISGDMLPYNTLLGYSPAISFALRLQELRPGYAIGLIPCAKGASSLYDWRRALSDNTLYGSCLKRMRAASTMGQLAGILFYQGETDALASWPTPLYHVDWGIHFTEIVNDLRGDTGTLSIVFVQIGNLPADRFPYLVNVQASQASIILPNTSMVSAIGLPTEVDGVHLTISGVQLLGVLMANAMDGLLP